MRFTLSWLRDHLDTTASLTELTTKLSAIGLEVEGVENPAEALAAFTIARVIEAKKHPNADKLQVAQVEVAPGNLRLWVNLGKADGVDEASFGTALTALGAPTDKMAKLELRGTYSYVHVAEGDAPAFEALAGKQHGEKALKISYEFKLELDKQAILGSFLTK